MSLIDTIVDSYNKYTWTGFGSKPYHDDLWFLKTRDTPSGKLEVHIATAKTQFKAFSCHTATRFSPNDLNDGTFHVEDDNTLKFVKQRNTYSQVVEVDTSYRLQKFGEGGGTTTGFSLSEAKDGHFRFSQYWLYFIKVRNCQSGKVEVYRADGFPNLQQKYHSSTREGPFVTDFDCADADNGSWHVAMEQRDQRHFNIIFIKTANTGTHKVEYHEMVMEPGSCRRIVSRASPFDPETHNGEYHPGRMGHVVFVKQRNSGSGTIEVMLGDGKDDTGKGVQYFESCLGAVEADKGLFLLGSPFVLKGPE